ncbi:MAG: class I SAM-dependent methyltransferase [Sediminibacterium sp.]|nr:class I SAM-dependent methyltransferase [Sediminibacterium sp.]
MNDYTIIEGFKCYNPEVAFSNNGFSPEAFDILHSTEQTNFWFRGRNRIILYMIRKFSGFSRKQRFLEIGCGNGIVLNSLRKSTNYELLGSDIYIQGLKNAKIRLKGVELIQADASKFIDANNYDAIGVFDVLEHIEEDKKVLHNLFQSLRPGGYLYITVPQYMYLWSQFDDIAFHKRRYEMMELLEKVKEAGFKVEYLGSFIFFLFPIMLVSRSLTKFKKSKEIKGTEEFISGKMINGILQFFIYLDEVLIRMGLRLPFGGSLICVAKKEENII